MSMLKKFNNIFASEEDELFENEQETVKNKNKEQEGKYQQNKPLKTKVNLSSAGRKEQVILTEPLVFADSKDIIDNLKANKVVILNLTKLDLQTSDRLLDFISGGIYAIDAKLKIIGDEIYLCVPNGIEVAGEFSEGDY